MTIDDIIDKLADPALAGQVYVGRQYTLAELTRDLEALQGELLAMLEEQGEYEPD